MGVFCFVDKIAELKPNESVTAFYTLKPTEEFLKDHFSDFPVMPGVLLLESLKQTASALLGTGSKGSASVYRILEATSVKFGQFVRPGSELRITARLVASEKDRYTFDGSIEASGRRALSARLILTPVSP